MFKSYKRIGRGCRIAYLSCLTVPILPLVSRIINIMLSDFLMIKNNGPLTLIHQLNVFVKL
jgi:hypothetical protein